MTHAQMDCDAAAPPEATASRRVALLRALPGHRLFAGVLILALAVRVVTMLGYRPAFLWYGDSFAYLRIAEHPAPIWGFQPSGYGFFLILLRPFQSVALVAAVQHLMGLGIAFMIYALLRRRGLPGWGAALATVPVLFDGQMLIIEHAVLSDTLFIFLMVAAVTALLWRPEITVRTAALAGGLLAAAALTRTIAVPVLGVIVLCLLLRRVGWRPVAAMVAVVAVPVLLYCGWYTAEHGRFTVAGGDGAALWARSMTFADCKKIKPPPDEAVLCPNGTRLDAASEYVWAPGSSFNRLPGGILDKNERARSFGLRAITAQPLDYLREVASDSSIAFHWTPKRHPKRLPTFGFAEERYTFPDDPVVRGAMAGFDPDVREYHSVKPYASFLIGYQHVTYLRGPLLAAIMVLGAWGLRRRGTLLPWVAAMALFVLPTAVLDFDHRYVLPVVPLACLAAALAFTPRPRSGANL